MYYSIIPPAWYCAALGPFSKLWECREAHSLLYAPTPIVIAYYRMLVLSGEHDNFSLLVAIAYHSVFLLVTFVSVSLYSECCTASGDFCGVEEFCKGGIIEPLSPGILDFVHDACFFEILRDCSFDVLQVYLAFRRTVEHYWSTKDHVW